VVPIVVVGLGNPGSEYETTRHNIGFQVADALSLRWKKPFKPGKGDYVVARGEIGGRPVVLAKPLTYMNNSGLAVQDVLERYDATPGALLVIVDDVALPLGVLRFRARGTDGGHNGLASVMYQLQSDEFFRLRCGIMQEAMPPKTVLADFVLSRFDPEEIDPVRAMIVRAADAVTEFVVSGAASAMNKYNT